MKISVDGKEISIKTVNEEDYISLTDMAKNYSDRPDLAIGNWMQTNNTLRFIGLWEELNNSDFNPLVFQGFKELMQENGRFISIKRLREEAGVISINSTPGRYGGTFAHIDLGFEFASWLSPEFKLYLITEFKRLKSDEAKRLDQEWNYSRFLSKVNYGLHTDSIKKNIVPRLGKGDEPHVFASEADLLNVAVFGMTAKEYREQSPDSKGNLREGASIRQLTVMANMESMNSYLIEAGASQEARFQAIYKEAQRQLEVFEEDRRLIE